MRSRRCWLGRSEKDRFDMAYSTGRRERELGLSQLTRVMYAVWEEKGRGGWTHVSWNAFSDFFFKSPFNVIHVHGDPSKDLCGLDR